MTTAEHQADAQRRRESLYFQMQQIEQQRRTLLDQFNAAQIALYKIDGELEFLARLAADAPPE